MKRCCHYCGQPLPERRLGVRLTPREGKIFDLILNAGESGISNADLIEILGGSGGNRGSLHVHVFNINEKLADTGYQIVGRDVRVLKQATRERPQDAISPEEQRRLGL